MIIRDFIWPDSQIEHIARHGVTTEEFEFVCRGNSRLNQTASRGENPVYFVYGQTREGRPLKCVIVRFPDQNVYPVTARDMTATELRRYRKWKKKRRK